MWNWGFPNSWISTWGRDSLLPFKIGCIHPMFTGFNHLYHLIPFFRDSIMHRFIIFNPNLGLIHPVNPKISEGVHEIFLGDMLRLHSSQVVPVIPVAPCESVVRRSGATKHWQYSPGRMMVWYLIMVYLP